MEQALQSNETINIFMNDFELDKISRIQTEEKTSNTNNQQQQEIRTYRDNSAGNKNKKEKKYKEALECYSQAINLDPNDPILYSNRSLMHINLSEFNEALEDANKAISIKADYAKAYLRKGTALKGLNDIEGALAAFKDGLTKDPNNTQLKDAVAEIEMQTQNPLQASSHSET